MQKYKLISNIALITLLVLGIGCSLMFYFGGNSAESLDVAGDMLSIPAFADLFLSWNYFLVALVCCVTLCVVVWDFVKTFKVSKKSALGQLAVVVCFIALVAICWLLGSPEEVRIIGYEGEDNIGFMAQLSDSCLYLTYILTCTTILVMLWGVWYTKHVK